MSRRETPDLPLFDLPLHGKPAGTEISANDSVHRKPSQSELFEEASGDLGDDPRGSDDDPHQDRHIAVLDRLLGGLIDLLIHAVVLLLVVAASWAMGAGLTVADWPAFAVFLLLFSLFYSGVPLAFWGQTPGMMRVGHVARTGSGEPLTFGQTARRWLGALLTLALAGLPLLLALGSSRSLADRLSGSYTESA